MFIATLEAFLTFKKSIMTVELKGDKLVITLELDKKGRPSASGKTLVHATTNGNQPTPIEIGGQPLVVGVNAYTKAKR